MLNLLMAIAFCVAGGAFVWFCMYMDKRGKLPPPSCIDRPTEAKTSRLAGLTAGHKVRPSKLSSGGSGVRDFAHDRPIGSEGRVVDLDGEIPAATRTVVPAPGVLSIERWAPITSARSRMPTSP